VSRLARAALLLAAAAALFAVILRPRRPGGEAARPPLAPSFAVTDLEGRRLALADFKGKVVLVDFWATWCEPCRVEIPAFVSLQSRYGPQGLQIVGISLDDDSTPVREFYARYHMNYPVALGSAALAEQFGGILGLPVAFLIDRGGRIRVKHVGQTEAAVFEKDIQGLLQEATP
jgi:cytochrome c biogenesis protein CcmG/thiol:disulfide interchange protein DsbE